MVDSLLDWMEDVGVALKLTLLLLLVVFASLIAFQFVTAPQQQRTQAFQQTLQALDHQLAGMERPGDAPESLNDEMDGLTPQVAAQKKVLGIHVPLDHLLPDIVDMAQSVGVTLTSWQPEEPMLMAEVNLNRVTLRLEAEGRYHALVHFLEALPRLPKALIVRSMDYQVRTERVEDSAIDVQASFELIGFEASARIEQHAPERATVQG